MAKGTRPRRKPKTPRTIDLEATPVVEDAASAKDEAAGVADAISDDGASEFSELNEPVDDSLGGKPAEIVKKRTSGVTMLGMLVAAVLGGGVALGGAGALNQAGLLKYVPFASGLIYGGDNKASENLDAIAAVDTKIAALALQVEALGAEVSANSGANSAGSEIPAEIASRIAAVETELANVRRSVSKGEGAVAAAGNAQDAARDAAKSAADANAKVDEVLAKVSELSQTIISAGSGVDAEAIKAALANETAALSTRLEVLEAIKPPSGPDPKVAEQLSELSTQMSDVATSVEALSPLAGQLTGRIAAVETTTSDIGSRVEAMQAKIQTDIMAPMADVQKAASAALVGQKVARSVSARALSSAIEQGGAFSGELASAEALLGTNEIITALEPMARSGVKTPAQLLASFSSVLDAIEAAENAPATDAGVVAKFLNNAKSLVKVRSIGPQDGDSASAIASRIVASLKAGDVAQAKSEWDGLPDEAKALSNSWVETLNQRLVAQDLVAKLVEVLASQSKG